MKVYQNWERPGYTSTRLTDEERAANFVAIWASSNADLSRLNRFFFAGAHGPGDLLQLDAERSNYLCRVLRLSDADPVDIFDGEGGLYRCKISKAHQRRAEIKVVEQIAAFDKPEQAPSLGMALLKGGHGSSHRSGDELEQHIWLLQADRNLLIRTERLEEKLGHWRRIIIP